MELTEQQKRGQELLFKIISEAWENDSFKQSLLTSPEEALEDLFGVKLSNSKKIKVTDQSDPAYLYINIPIKPQDEHQVVEKADVPTDADQGSFTMTDYKTLYSSLDEKLD